ALIAAGHDLIEPDPVDLDLVRQVHDPFYIEFLATAWTRWLTRTNPGPAAMGYTWPGRGMRPERPDNLLGQLGYHSFAADCSIVEGTWEAVQASAAVATTAADRAHDSGPVFGLCRPPGHHASTDQFGGYCYVNNAAVAAQRLLNRGARRVAVLDVDYHHGNGTQEIFYDRADVMVVSIHADPSFEFPWFSGYDHETGEGPGEGSNLNLPLPAGTDFAGWNAVLSRGLATISDADVDGVVVSLGVDTFDRDPLGTFDIQTDDFTAMADRIAGLGVPTVVVQEGGYAVDEIGRNVAAFLAGMA
ncbi:MAG: histone deacetylase family protein, partial [Acidimicrobiales bacterium]|nr:histone deacetylase family protein [Acidimicrobiales bacterium]